MLPSQLRNRSRGVSSWTRPAGRARDREEGEKHAEDLFWLRKGVQVKAAVILRSVVACLLLTACSLTSAAEGRPACVERSSDGPWYAVGAKTPREAELTSAYKAGGEARLRALLGPPFRSSKSELIWIYEKRREYSYKSCNPPKVNTEYDQLFSILRLQKRGQRSVCVVEMREFIGESTVSRDEALDLPAPPLSDRPRECGN